MKKLLLLFLISYSTLYAQTLPPGTPSYVQGASVVSSCGAASLTAATLNQLYMNSTGQLCVNASVSASITFPYGASPAATTANSFLGAGCVYNSSPPSPTSGQYVPLQCNASGNLDVNASASVTFPYGSGSGQTATSASFIGIVAYNGTTVDALKDNNSAGALNTYVVNTVPVSGTFWQTTQPVSFTKQSVDIFGNSGVALDASPGSTAPSNGLFIGGVYNSTLPTLINGEYGALQLDSSSRQLINISVLPSIPSGSNTIGAVTQASGPWTFNATQWDGTALGAPSNYGTSPGAVEVPGVNAFITNTPNVNIQSNATMNLTELNSVALGSPSTYGTSPGSVNVIGVNADVTNNVNILGTLSNNGAAATSNAIADLPGIVQTTPANGAAYTQGRNVSLNIDTGGNSWVTIQPSLRPAHYRASANFAASSTTDNACIYGNATDTIELIEVDVSGVQTTSGSIIVSLNRHSAAESGGTSSNMTVITGDVTHYGSADSTPVSYTGTGPTTTNLGTIDQKYTTFNSTSLSVPSDLYIWDGHSEPQLLIGTSQGVCVNIGGALTGGQMSVVFSWKEISNISE